MNTPSITVRADDPFTREVIAWAIASDVQFEIAVHSFVDYKAGGVQKVAPIVTFGPLTPEQWDQLHSLTGSPINREKPDVIVGDGHNAAATKEPS